MSLVVTSFVLLLLISLSLIIIGGLVNSEKLIIVNSVIAILLSRVSHIAELTSNIGIGLPTLLTLLIILVLLIFYRLNIDFSKFPRFLVGNEGKMLVLFLFFAFLSVLKSEELVRSIKAYVNLLFFIFLGWIVFGFILKLKKDHIRDFMTLLLTGIGLYSTIYTFLILIFAPFELEGSVDSQISIFSFTVQRLQSPGFNATTVGQYSSISLMWLFSLFARSKPLLLKAIIILFSVLGFIALIWSGSRGAILAFFGSVLLLWLIFGKFQFSHLVIYLLVLSGFVYFFTTEFQGILYRNPINTSSPSLVDMFLNSRLFIYGNEIYSLFEPTLIGKGFGYLSTISGDDNSINIESFILRIYIELGLIGSFIYLLLLVKLTSNVIKVDLYFKELNQRGVFFMSSFFLFTWLNSPTSFGFSIPTGDLAMQFALASGSTLFLAVIKKKKHDE